MRDAVKRSKGNKKQAQTAKKRWKEANKKQRTMRAYIALAVLGPIALAALMYPLHSMGYYRLWAPSALTTALNNPAGALELNLAREYLDQVPSEIDQLEKLQELNLDSNNISELGPITNLKNLRVLRISYNKLGKLPPDMKKMENLQEIYLSGNQLSSLPKELFELENLEVLVVKNNALTSIPPDLKKLKNLRILDLKNNQISSLPDSLSHLKRLERLYLSGNTLSTIPDVSGLKSLENISVRDSGLRPTEIDRLRSQVGRGTAVNS